MRIVFQKLRYKNLLSTGNIFTEVQLDKASTTLASGKNGSGKCVRGSTEVEITFKDEETRKKYEDFIEKNK